MCDSELRVLKFHLRGLVEAVVLVLAFKLQEEGVVISTWETKGGREGGREGG